MDKHRILAVLASGIALLATISLLDEINLPEEFACLPIFVQCGAAPNETEKTQSIIRNE